MWVKNSAECVFNTDDIICVLPSEEMGIDYEVHTADGEFSLSAEEYESLCTLLSPIELTKPIKKLGYGH